MQSSRIARKEEMTVICSQCQKEFEASRITRKFCSEKCKKQSQRVSGTLQGQEVVSGTNVPVKEETVPVKDLAGQNTAIAGQYYLEENAKNYNPDPLKRITLVPMSVTKEWYTSFDYENLLEELTKKSIKQLRQESYFIPRWKSMGMSKNDVIGHKVTI